MGARQEPAKLKGAGVALSRFPLPSAVLVKRWKESNKSCSFPLCNSVCRHHLSSSCRLRIVHRFLVWTRSSPSTHASRLCPY